MIRITIFKDTDKYIKRITVSGHAGYGNKGEDIVCAGVSALTYTMLNALESLVHIKPKCEVRSGYVDYIMPDNINIKELEKVQLILNTIVIGYKNMYDSYKSHIEVFEEEV